MPASYHIDVERALVTFRLWGAVDGALLRSIAEDLIADPRWNASYDRLWDWREITELVVLLDDVKAVSTTIHQNWEAAPRVAVAARRQTDLAIAKLIRAYMPDLPIGVFTEIEAAESFLMDARHGGEALGS